MPQAIVFHDASALREVVVGTHPSAAGSAASLDVLILIHIRARLRVGDDFGQLGITFVVVVVVVGTLLTAFEVRLF